MVSHWCHPFITPRPSCLVTPALIEWHERFWRTFFQPKNGPFFPLKEKFLWQIFVSFQIFHVRNEKQNSQADIFFLASSPLPKLGKILLLVFCWKNVTFLHGIFWGKVHFFLNVSWKMHTLLQATH